jgi:hypothetical protein
MQTAITPRNASKSIEFYWDSELRPNDPSPGYIAVLYFAELEALPSSAVRQFDINLNNKIWYRGYTPHRYTYTIHSISPMRGSPRYNFSMDATTNSTLPPIINAIEVFSVISTTNVGTYSQDGRCMYSSYTIYTITMRT